MRIFTVFVFAAATLLGQTFRGAIEGTVQDTSGAAVPSVKVTVSNAETGLSREATADELGNYKFTELPLGAYAKRLLAYEALFGSTRDHLRRYGSLISKPAIAAEGLLAVAG